MSETTDTKKVRQALKDGVKNSQHNVLKEVEGHYVSQEVERRSQLIIKGLDKLEQQEVELGKIKPDSQVYDENGELTYEGYTKGAVDKRKKLQEGVNKLNKALDAAITEANYDQLEKQSK